MPIGVMIDDVPLYIDTITAGGNDQYGRSILYALTNHGIWKYCDGKVPYGMEEELKGPGQWTKLPEIPWNDQK